MRIAGSRIEFWNDQPQGTGVGVAAPARWRIQYWDLDTGQWAAAPNPSGYPTGTRGAAGFALRALRRRRRRRLAELLARTWDEGRAAGQAASRAGRG